MIVVHEHDVTATEGVPLKPGAHLIRLLAGPVLRIDIPQNDGLASAPELPQLGRRQLAMRGTKEIGRLAQQSGQEFAGALDLRAQLRGRRLLRVGVVEGMMPDRVAFLDDAANDLRVALDLLADEKEGRGHASALEDIQQAGRMFRIGAVVEGQTNRAAGGRATPEQTPPRQGVRQASASRTTFATPSGRLGRTVSSAARYQSGKSSGKTGPTNETAPFNWRSLQARSRPERSGPSPTRQMRTSRWGWCSRSAAA